MAYLILCMCMCTCNVQYILKKKIKNIWISLLKGSYLKFLVATLYSYVEFVC